MDALGTGVVAVKESLPGRRMRDKMLVQRRVAGCREGLMACNRDGRDQQKQKKRKDLNRRWETRGLAKGGWFLAMRERVVNRWSRVAVRGPDSVGGSEVGALLGVHGGAQNERRA